MNGPIVDRLRRRLRRRRPRLFVDCDICDNHHTDQWVAIVWQHEVNDSRGGIKVAGSDLLAVLCMDHAEQLQDAVRRAVDKAVDPSPVPSRSEVYAAVTDALRADGSRAALPIAIDALVEHGWLHIRDDNEAVSP